LGELSVIFHPGMIEAGVVGNEIEQQAQATGTQSLAQPGQRRVPAELRMYRVTGDRETRTENVLCAQIR